jgi:nicotinate dehydrogenase subunit B
MSEVITLNINGKRYTVDIDPETPLLYVLRNDCGLFSPKYGCGLEQCGSCKVIIDGDAVPTCRLPVREVVDSEIVTLEGLSAEGQLHPMQQAFLDEQAAQCGFCTAGMITTAAALCRQNEKPSDEDIRQAMERHLCRCGVYDRLFRAIRSSLDRPVSSAKYEVVEMPPFPSPTANVALPQLIQHQPELDAWIKVGEDGTITVFTGRVELGQGIKTSLAQIAADELDVDFNRIRVLTGDTQLSPDEGGTMGSMSIEISGSAIRVAAAEARRILLSLAFEELEAKTSASELIVQDGTVLDPETGRIITYQALMGGRPFGHRITRPIPLKNPKEYHTVGQGQPRGDLLAKLTGQPAYVHDLVFPEMLHARVLRPPHYHARLASLDIDAIQQLPGVVQVIRDGSFVAIVAEHEAQAMYALQQAAAFATWSEKATLIDQRRLYDDLMSRPAVSQLIVDGTGVDAPVPDIRNPEQAVQTLKAGYRRPYHMHGSIGPSAAVALWQDQHLTVWSHSQGVFSLRDSIAQVLKLPVERIRVIHVEGAGCYGHNGADDAALDAALTALQLPGRPISLKWMRDQEHAWEPYGSAMAMEMQASLDTEGRIIYWSHDVWSYGHSTRPRAGLPTSGLLAAWHLEDPFERQQPVAIGGYHFGSHRNADPLYAFPEKRVVRHEVADSPLRVSALRSLGAYANVFAIESFMDELAVAAGMDPLEFRLNHLTDERAKAVLQAAAQKAGWQTRRQNAEDHTGWGIAFAQYKNRQSYAAIVVNVSVDPETGKIQVIRATIAADAGLIINADGLSSQMEGGFVQALSWTLHEQVNYDESGILSRDWASYPILRFPDAPAVETVLLNRPDQPSLGAGEATQNPTPAAVANAIYDAVGVRLRDLPFTPDKVKALLKDQS